MKNRRTVNNRNDNSKAPQGAKWLSQRRRTYTLDEGNDTESNVISPNVLGECVVLMGPWYGGVDRLSVHIQPFTHPPEAFLEHRHDASVVGRANIHQQIATAAVRTHDTIRIRYRTLRLQKNPPKNGVQRHGKTQKVGQYQIRLHFNRSATRRYGIGEGWGGLKGTFLGNDHMPLQCVMYFRCHGVSSES